MHNEPSTREHATTRADVSGVVSRVTRTDGTGPFPIGATIGGTYQIRGVLGAGGMGVVYEAFDLALARRVAIKAALATVFAAPLRAEAHALAALRSTSFVEVYALGCHEGIDFLVMELLRGERLDLRIDDAITRGSYLPLDEVVHALTGLAVALRAAHVAGISQRDVKPSNTIVMGERVVLFDFGLALPEVFVEETSMLSGSVDYLAPELILGKVRRGEGALVDLYALGICAYELLTNRAPFSSESAALTLSRHISELPPDIRETRPEVPTELALLVRDLLEKDPDDRPGSAEAVLWRLEALKRQREDMSRPATAVLAVTAERALVRTLKEGLESRFRGLTVEATMDPFRTRAGPSTPPPDVVLIDLDHPEQNCIETCAGLVAQPLSRRAVVIGLGGRASEGDLALLQSLGMQAVICKNADLVPELTRVIRGLQS